MRIYLLLIIFFSMSVILSGGCATTESKYPYQELNYKKDVKYAVLKGLSLTPDIEEKILALDPEHITEKEIKDVLSHAPAPRIIKIHGGVYPVRLMTALMKSFSEFFISMGYPD